MTSSTGGPAPRLVFVTAPSEEVARRLAHQLVRQRLVACANIVPGITSVYRWEGEVQEDAEVLLLLKTTGDRVRALEEALAELHPYDVPECVAVEPASVEARYLEWMLQALAGDD